MVLKAGNTEQEMELESNPMLSGELLHKMFARRMIQELEEESQVGSKERELIKDLSLKYNIMSRFTSFIAVDQRLDKEEEMGEMLVRRVDNMTPHRFGRVQLGCLGAWGDDDLDLEGIGYFAMDAEDDDGGEGDGWAPESDDDLDYLEPYLLEAAGGGEEDGYRSDSLFDCSKFTPRYQ